MKTDPRFKKAIKLALFKGMFIVLSLLLSCAPNSLEDFHYEGEAWCKLFVNELKKIHHREDLSSAAPIIKKYFDDLVILMIQAREFRENHLDEISYFRSENLFSSALENELRRIYAIEGGREFIEQSQQEALLRLDAFERACLKKRQALR